MNDKLFNIVSPLVIAINTLLSVISALTSQWSLFIVWTSLLVVIVLGFLYMKGWINIPDFKKIKNIIPAKQKKAEEKKQKKRFSSKKRKRYAKAIKKKIKKQEKKKMKVYKTKEENVEPKIIESKRPYVKIIDLKKPEPKSETKAKKVETEFDIFINMIKEKKEVGLNEVEKKFNLTKEKAEEWAKLLESHGLIEIRYPAFGEPKLIYKEQK